jgi:hypothetical protein
MKSQPLMIDQEMLKADMLGVVNFTGARGARVYNVSAAVCISTKYDAYPEAYVVECVKYMLENLAWQGLIVLKGDRYFPANKAATQ